MLAPIHKPSSIRRLETPVWPRDERIRDVLPDRKFVSEPSVDLIKGGGFAKQRRGAQLGRENYEL
jgi:hypothetical protein